MQKQQVQQIPYNSSHDAAGNMPTKSS